MKESSDQDATEPSSEEERYLDATSRKGRFRAAFGFLRAPSFWGGLVVGLVALGVGVVIGLGMDRWMDGDRGKNDGWGGGPTIHSFRMDDGELLGEGPFGPDGKRFRFRDPAGRLGDWKEKWEEKRFTEERSEWEEFSDFYLAAEAMDLAERLIDAIEEMTDEVGEYLEDRDAGPRAGGQFGFGRFFDDEFWGDFEGRLFGDEYRKGERGSWGDDGSWDDYGRDKDFWEDEKEDDGFWDEGAGPFEGFGFPFGELLPGLMFLEDCELDFESLPDILENLPDSEDGGYEDSEDFEEFFAEMEEMFREACEPSDG